MLKHVLGASLALSLALPAVATEHAPQQPAGDPGAGKAKSAVCAGCHGADGNSPSAGFPKLAGQHVRYIAKQLQDYQAGNRKNATMKPQAAGLQEQDISDLAAYFSSQPVKLGEADPALVEKGREIYRGGNPASGVAACASCHGPSGAGNPAARFPALSGQHADYTVAQLQQFHSGERANDAGKMMRNIAARMTDAEMRAVASFIEGLH